VAAGAEGDWVNYVERAYDLLLTELPELNGHLADFYVLLVLTRGVNTTNRDVHDAWSVWAELTYTSHESLVPYQELSEEKQQLDTKYRDAIIRVSERYWNG
jgi:hypothetical protein